MNRGLHDLIIGAISPRAFNKRTVCRILQQPNPDKFCSSREDRASAVETTHITDIVSVLHGQGITYSLEVMSQSCRGWVCVVRPASSKRDPSLYTSCTQASLTVPVGGSVSLM